MSGNHSLQGIPRPDRILYNRGDGRSSAYISSTGYYHGGGDSPPKEMEAYHVVRAFTIANQFNGFSEPSPHASTYHPKCCDFRKTYFQYQGVRLPVVFVPQLHEIFMRYSQ